MTDLSDLTPRQIAVASLVARGYTPQAIAAELTPPISERRVYALITSIAYKIGADPGKDDKVQVAAWWHAQVIATPPKKAVA